MCVCVCVCVYIRYCRQHFFVRVMTTTPVADFANSQLYIVAEFSDGGDGGPDPTRPIPEEPATQILLRSALGKQFPVKVKARRYRNGMTTCLSQSDCRRLFQRLRAHAAAYVDLHRWGVEQPRGSCTPSAAVTFWYSTYCESLHHAGADLNGGADPQCLRPLKKPALGDIIVLHMLGG